MDYDDNDSEDQNHHLAGEGSSKVSPALCPYALPKFDFDDSLPGHLRFDCLVENEVFLGISSQEDNQWIEEYSRGTSAIQFSSSVAESRHKNVWSEATSSESVEMLLKSVGQEDRVVEETIIEELDACDEPGSLSNIMDPNLKQCDGKDHFVNAHNAIVSDEFQENFVGSKLSSDCEQSHARFTSQSQETRSGGELDSVVIDDKYRVSVADKKVDKIWDDVNQVSDLANESFKNESQEDPFVSKVECGNAGIEELKSQENPQEVPERCTENSSGVSKNFSSSEVERVIEAKDNNLDSPTKSGTIIETCTYSEEKQSVEVSIPVDEEPIDSLSIGRCGMQIVEGCNAHECSAENFQGSKSAATASVICLEINQEPNDRLHEESLAGSLNGGSVKMLAIEEANTKSEVPGSPKSNAGSLSPNKDVIAQENDSKVHTGDSIDEDWNLPAKLSGLAQVGDETRSTDSGAISTDHDVSFNERGDARLPLDSGDMDMEVVGASDSHKNVESSSSAEGCKGFIAKAHGFESNIAVLTDAVAAVESSEKSSPDSPDGVLSGSVATADIVTEDKPKSPILGVSLLHDDNEEKAVGFSSEGRAKEGTPEVQSVVDRMFEGPLSVVEIDAVSDCAGKLVYGMAGHCDPPVENCNASLRLQVAEDNAGGLECSKTMETTPLPSDASAEDGSNAEVRALPDPKGLVAGQDRAEPLNLAVNLSDEQQASVDVAGPCECDSVSSDKPQILARSAGNSIEPSQSAKAKHDAAKGSLYENSPLSKVLNEAKGKVQSVSLNSATKDEKSFTFEVSASAGPGPIGIQDLNLAKNMKVPSVNSSGSLLDPNKLHEVSLVSLQTPISPATQEGAKGKSEHKATRKSGGKGSAKKSNQMKEKTSVRRSEELKPNESVEHSNPKPSGSLPIPMSNLPDLNNSTSIFQQSFTDNQQVQLRAQILVYGSLIAGMPPEEPHMIAAFGQSDGGRRAWDAAWHAYLERFNHKPLANNSDTPMQSRSVLNNKGNKDPSNMSTSSPVVSPMIPISSPLWNISTPCDGLPSSAIPRSPLLDNRQALSPQQPFQPPRGQNFAGHPFPGQWISSSPISAFGARFNALPITDAVKLTTVKESAIPVGHSASPSVFPASSPLSNVKNATSQPSSDSKSRKRKKDAASVAGSTSTPVVHLPRVPHTEGYNQISFLAQNQTPSTSSKSNHGGFLSAVSHSDQNVEKGVTTEENLSKVEESKLRAEDAATHAAAAISHCEGVWSQLERHKNSGLVTEDEAKLASSAASIAAASSVAKVAAAAAKIASDVAEQARLMAEEVFLSSRIEFDKSKPASILTSADRNESNVHPNSIISAAREAARWRIEAASAAAKHAENLDAIVKAAEWAAEAVSQAGKIVAMGNPLPLRDLVKAGPEGYWKTARLSNQSGYSDPKNLEAAANGKEIHTAKLGFLPEKDSGNLAENQTMVIDDTHEHDERKAKAQRSPDLSKTLRVVPEPESGSIHTSVDQNMPQSTSGTSKENIIKESCLVEVYKDDNKHKNAWYAANVLSLKDGKAFVCYTEIQSDEGTGQLKEWVLLEIEGTETPKIRIAHPVTTMRFEGTKKRRRTAVTDYVWSSGDRVDVWVEDCWREGVVRETNKTDATSLTVQFPAQEEMSVVRSWHVRPTLVWKDGNWIDWFSLKGSRTSESDTPREKRPKLGMLKSLKNVESGRHEESRILPVSARESSFDVGKSSRDENRLKTRKITKSGLQKEGPGVVFGVPKPGKKQKFMDVSYVADGNNKNNAPNDSAKIASYLIPRGSKKISKNDAMEKQVAETKSKVLKPRKPPVPTIGTLAQKDRSKSRKPALMIDKTVEGSENLPGHHNRMEFGSSSNTEDAMEGSAFHSDVPEEVLTSKTVSKRVNKVSGGNLTKGEVKDKSSSELGEPRRSNRRIQPTSRLLEGLQSSLTISKTPAVSHTSQRSHNKVPPKGNTNQG